MFLDQLTEWIINSDYEPLTVLGADADDADSSKQELVALRKKALQDIERAGEVLDLYRRILQKPTLDDFVGFVGTCGLHPDDQQAYLLAAIRYLADHDEGQRDVDGYTASEVFARNRDVVFVAYLHEQRGLGVAAIARQTGSARSTVYGQLKRFERWPAETRETLLKCMHMLLAANKAESPLAVG